MDNAVLRVEDLVATASLDVRVLAGRDGLRRELLWAHSCEMPSPEQWLGPHEMLLTVGVSMPTDADGQRAYIARLDEAGLAGVMIGDHPPAPPLTPAMFEEADQRGFPVLLAGPRTPYATIVRHVAAANWSTQSLQVLRLSKLYHLATFADDDLDSLLRSMADVVRVGLAIEDVETGILLARAQHTSNPEVATHARRHRLRGAHAADLVITEYADEQLDGFLLVHLMKMLEVASDHVLNTATRRAELAAKLFTELLTGRVRPASLDALQPHSLSDGYHVVAFDHEHTHRVARAVTLSSRPALVTQGRWHGLGLVPAAEINRFRDDLAGLELRAAASSRFFDATDVPAAANEAIKVFVDTSLSARQWTEFEGLSIAVLTRSRRESEEILTSTLGPLAAKTPRAATLRETLFTYLQHDRQWTPTASALGIHRQTLAYRLQRIAAETGLDLARTGDLAALWIAMHAWQVLHPTAPDRT